MQDAYKAVGQLSCTAIHPLNRPPLAAVKSPSWSLTLRGGASLHNGGGNFSETENTEKLSLLSYVTVLGYSSRQNEINEKDRRICCRVLSRFRHPLRYSIVQFSILRGRIRKCHFSRNMALFRGHQRASATRWKLSVRRNYTEFQRGEPPAGKLGRNLNLAVDERPARD